MYVCSICGTQYVDRDARDTCEGNAPYFRADERGQRLVLDPLKAEVGEDVIITRYIGDDYAQPPYKAGLKLVWEWAKVREKRIVPALVGLAEPMLHGNRYRHEAQYKFTPSPEDEAKEIAAKTNSDPANYIKMLTKMDHWEDGHGGGIAFAMPFGPRHVWTRYVVEHPEVQDDECERYGWPGYIMNYMASGGPATPENLKRLANEGYVVYGVNK